MMYLAILGAGLFVGFAFGAAYYSAELFRLAEENLKLYEGNVNLIEERNRFRDAQDTFKTKQRTNWGA